MWDEFMSWCCGTRGTIIAPWKISLSSWSEGKWSSECTKVKFCLRSLVQKEKNLNLNLRCNSVLHSLIGSFYISVTGSCLVQVMADRLSNAKPLSEPIQTYCQLQPEKQLSNEVWMKMKQKRFLIICFSTCHQQNVGHLYKPQHIKQLCSVNVCFAKHTKCIFIVIHFKFHLSLFLMVQLMIMQYQGWSWVCAQPMRDGVTL